MDENQAFQEARPFDPCMQPLPFVSLRSEEHRMLQVTTVGKIAAVRHGAGDGNCIDFQLFDGTGGMQVQYYPDPESGVRAAVTPLPLYNTHRELR